MKRITIMIELSDDEYLQLRDDADNHDYGVEDFIDEYICSFLFDTIDEFETTQVAIKTEDL